MESGLIDGGVDGEHNGVCFEGISEIFAMQDEFRCGVHVTKSTSHELVHVYSTP